MYALHCEALVHKCTSVHSSKCVEFNITHVSVCCCYINSYVLAKLSLSYPIGWIDQWVDVSYHIITHGVCVCMYVHVCKVKTSVTVLSSCLQLRKYLYQILIVYMINTYSNRRVANHLHGLIFELKERMDSRQDRPVMTQCIYVLDICVHCLDIGLSVVCSFMIVDCVCIRSFIRSYIISINHLLKMNE
jgi:hypothetical protein